MIVGEVSGSGSITANGGSGEPGNHASGGGGGRVAVYYSSNAGFDLNNVTASGGLASSSSEADGEGGSVYIEQNEPVAYVYATTLPELSGNDIQSFALDFSVAMDPTSFEVSDVLLESDQGAVVYPESIETVSDKRYSVSYAQPLSHGSYVLSVGPDIRTQGGMLMDQNQNDIAGEADDHFQYEFVVDKEAPSAVTVVAELAPAVNATTQSNYTLSGTREDNTAIWVNGDRVVAQGSGDWQAELDLSEGMNTLEVWARDLAGNDSESIEVLLDLDTQAPAIESASPADWLSTGAESVEVQWTEEGSGLNGEASNIEVLRGGSPVPGSQSLADNTLSFSPDIPFTESEYSYQVTLEDNYGNQNTASYSFVLDYTPPAPPQVSDYPAFTTINEQEFSGQKEVGARVYVDGEAAEAGYDAETWSFTKPLSFGENEITIEARDRAGNVSEPVVASVQYNDQPPEPVELSINPEGRGIELHLSWVGYDEYQNGNDIATYRVYLSGTQYTSVDELDGPYKEVPAGTQTTLLTGLERGLEYFVSVVAVNAQGLYTAAVSPLAATPVDVEPPAAPANLQVTPGATQLDLAWDVSANDEGDLSHYALSYQADGGADTLELAPEDIETGGQAGYTLSGLAPATAHNLSVSAVDQAGNQSAGLEDPGVTLLDNPALGEAEGFAGRASLNWSAATPEDLVSRYAIYVQSEPFSSVAGLEPVLTVSGSTTERSVAGLEDGQTVHIAVTAVNLSGGESPDVEPTPVTPEEDQEGPEVSELVYRQGGSSLAFAGGPTLTESGEIQLTADDRSSVSHLHLHIDGEMVANLPGNPSGDYRHPVDLKEIADGAHQLKVLAYDTQDNQTEATHEFSVALSAPEAPSITNPVGGTVTNKASQSVKGGSAAGTEVRVLNGGQVVVEPVPVDRLGEYGAILTLEEGENILTAQARYPDRGGWSEESDAVSLTLDTQLPDAPRGLSARAAEQGQVYLDWNQVVSEDSENEIDSYNVYRSDSEIENTDSALVYQLNDNPVTDARYVDLAIDDGAYYYAVTAINSVGNESNPSRNAEAEVDSTGPKAVEVDYQAEGAYDPETERFGQGPIAIEVTFDEKLRNDPYFAIVPHEGTPHAIGLDRVRGSDTRYTGRFEVTESTPSGTAYAVLSAHDEAGNRGTEIEQGATLEIDAQGPGVAELLLSPAAPLKVDDVDGLTVEVSVRLDGPVKEGTVPSLTPLLDQQPIPGYEDGLTLHKDSRPGETQPRWLGELTLPPTAGTDDDGEPAVQQLEFDYAGYDQLDNQGTAIAGRDSFQVYQGELPPLEVPRGLTASPQPAGEVQLDWEAVDKAHEYQLLRKGPEEEELTELATVREAQFRDQTDLDGRYQYAVASVRKHNDEESASAPSDAVEVDTSRIAPAAPENLALELTGQGVRAQWDGPTLDAQEQPLGNDEIRYHLYRLALSEGEQVSSTEGLSPLEDALSAEEALDNAPSEGEHSYFVTAVDPAGNESVPSETVYLDFGLLPVKNLSVSQPDGQQPVLSWRGEGESVSQYEVYRDLGDGYERLTDEPLPRNSAQTSYTDGDYDPDLHGSETIHYRVVALDDQGTESPSNEVTLPALRLALTEDETRLDRGVMNEVRFRVENLGAADQDDLLLKVTVSSGGNEWHHQSETFDLDAGSSNLVPVVIGGYHELDSVADLELELEKMLPGGGSVVIAQNAETRVGDDLLSASLTADNFVRGATGTAHFEIENTSGVESEILLSRDSGNEPSDELRLVLEDEDDNILATQPVQQFSGGVALSNGMTVARIAPGESFQSQPVEMDVPAGAPDRVSLRLAVDKLRYHTGRDTEVSIEGAGTRTDLTLNETPYYAEVTEVSPETVYGDGETIEIRGRALRRSDDEPRANVPVKLVLTVDGFEQDFTTYTNGDGEFSHEYESTDNAGIYRVSALHPDVQERPDHGQFQIVGARVNPRRLELNIPRNYTQDIPIRVTAGRDSTLTNVRLIPASVDGDSTPQLPQGVTAEFDSLDQVEAGETAVVTIHFNGDNSAARTGQVAYRVEADHFSGDKALGEITIDYTLSEAAPVLSASPSFIETGVGLEEKVSETLELENTGLDDLNAGRVELVTTEGSPAPDWVRLLTNTELGDMEVGDSQELRVRVAPNAQTSEGNYEFVLRASGDNLETREFPVFVTVTQSGEGDAFFHVSDIYTATLDEDNQIIPGLEDARIELQNEQVLSETYTLETDVNGEATFENIPAGRYRYRASAFDHESKSGRIWVKPGVTQSENVFLMNSVVNIEWSTREIALEDSYEIEIDATYETDVPVAVVVFEPLSVQLPVMEKGDVFQGELTLENHGLIRASAMEHTLPRSSDKVQFEFLREIPETLEAGEALTIPYKVRALKDFNPEADATATGGGCGSLNEKTEVDYESECANGEVVPSQTSVNWNSNWGNCRGGGSGGDSGDYGFGGGASAYIGIGGFGVSGDGVSHSRSEEPISSEDDVCEPEDIEDDSCDQANSSGQ